VVQTVAHSLGDRVGQVLTSGRGSKTAVAKTVGTSGTRPTYRRAWLPRDAAAGLALALTVVVGQLPTLCGFSVDATGLVPEARAFAEGLRDGRTNGAALALGAGCLAVILGCRRHRRRGRAGSGGAGRRAGGGRAAPGPPRQAQTASSCAPGVLHEHTAWAVELRLHLPRRANGQVADRQRTVNPLS
jgi:hypothetical protein